jgi:purine nucleoside permease
MLRNRGSLELLAFTPLHLFHSRQLRNNYVTLRILYTILSTIDFSQTALTEKVMVITNKQAEFEALCQQLEDLKKATTKKHDGLSAELAARQSEVKNITQIKTVRT